MKYIVRISTILVNCVFIASLMSAMDAPREHKNACRDMQERCASRMRKVVPSVRTMAMFNIVASLGATAHSAIQGDRDGVFLGLAIACMSRQAFYHATQADRAKAKK